MKSILFNTEMVRAILDGRKTVTRRVLKTEKHIPDDAVFGYTGFTPKGYISCRGTFVDDNGNKRYGENYIKIPYQIGDILYIRETWAKISDWIDVDPEVGIFDGYIYKASWANGEEHPAWRPSIHMPKEAARIFLRVTDVKVERLQDITEEQAKAEGIDTNNKTLSARCIFQYHLWNSTIKKSDLDKYGWDANPWVTVNKFERIKNVHSLP